MHPSRPVKIGEHRRSAISGSQQALKGVVPGSVCDPPADGSTVRALIDPVFVH
jgi:hypothetical protein